jgi:hypothetical protein
MICFRHAERGPLRNVGAHGELLVPRLPLN